MWWHFRFVLALMWRTNPVRLWQIPYDDYHNTDEFTPSEAADAEVESWGS